MKNSHRVRSFAAAWFGVSLGVAATALRAQVSFYSYYDIGDPRGVARGISADGSVVVGQNSSLSSAIRWTTNGAGYDPTYYPATTFGTYIAVSGVSPDGSVMVGYDGADAFKWSQADGRVALPGVPGYARNIATSASQNGGVIAGFGTATDGSSALAFRWTQSTGTTSIGTLPGTSNSRAWSISGDGTTIVGSSFTLVNNIEQGTAFRWTETDGMVSLGTLPGNAYSGAAAISSNGQYIVGSSAPLSTSGLVSQAFLWSEAEGMIGLGTLPGGEWSSATGVSNMGNLIVGNADSGSGDFSTAFIWTPNSGMRSLQDVLFNDLGVFTYGLALTYAYGMSADGRFIAGSSISNGHEIPWILDLGENPPTISPPRLPAVPESSTYGLAGAALGVLAIASGIRRRRRSSDARNSDPLS